MSERFAELLTNRHERLVAYCLKHAGTLLRYEAAEDLVQGIHVAAVKRQSGLDLRSDGEFDAWLFTVARGFLAHRRVHWSRLKRRSGALLRITTAGNSLLDDPRAVLEPSVTATGPSTFAARREQLVIATRALSLLSPRDQRYVRWYRDGVSLEDQAGELGTSYDAARMGQSRALERFKKSFRLLSR